MKECFTNATKLAFENRNLVYTEGVARRFCGKRYLPFFHAWCIRQDGTVIDPTWADPSGIEYFGIAFKTVFANALIEKTQQMNLIDIHSLHLIMAVPVDLWRHPIHDKMANRYDSKQ